MSKTVTKADIAKSICAQSEMKQQHAKKVLDAMLGIMTVSYTHLPRLGSIVGRVDTTARIKGMFVYPHQVEQVMARFEDIKRWQIEVINPGGIDEMILYVEASNFHQDVYKRQIVCSRRAPIFSVRVFTSSAKAAISRRPSSVNSIRTPSVSSMASYCRVSEL